MQLIPGGSLIFSFDVQSSTGTPVNFDAAPTVTFYHNGVADATWTSYTLTNVVAGHYVLTTTIPSGYALADEISVYVNGTISSVAVGLTAFEGQLANTPDNATLAVGQTFSTTGAVGSVTAPVTLPTAVPAAYATAANQTTILSQTTAASIAAAVWNALLASYVATASFGKWVNGLISSLISTSGQTTPTPIATNASGYVTFSNAIPTPPTAAQIATQIFTDVLTGSDFATAGTYGYLWHAATLNGNNINSYAVNAASGGGTGSAALSFTVKSTAAGTAVIPNANVSVIDASGAAVASGVTNGSGVASGMACAPGSYTYAVDAGNFAGISGTLTPPPVAGNNPYTFSLVPISPVVPLSGSIVGVSNTYVDGVVTGSVAVEYYMASVGSTSGSAFSGATSLSPLTATSNASGVLSIAFPYGTIWRIKGNPDVEIDVPTSGTQFEMPSVRI